MNKNQSDYKTEQIWEIMGRTGCSNAEAEIIFALNGIGYRLYEVLQAIKKEKPNKRKGK